MVLALNDIISARPEGVNKVKSQRVLSFANSYPSLFTIYIYMNAAPLPTIPPLPLSPSLPLSLSLPIISLPSHYLPPFPLSPSLPIISLPSHHPLPFPLSPSSPSHYLPPPLTLRSAGHTPIWQYGFICRGLSGRMRRKSVSACLRISSCGNGHPLQIELSSRVISCNHRTTLERET